MKVAYDAELKRPACAILQAVLGGDERVSVLFPAETWLLAPTSDMTLYEVPEDLLPALVQTTMDHFEKTGNDR